MRLRALLVVPLAVLCGVALAAPATAADPATPTVGTVAVAGSAPGNVVTVTGTGFDRGAVVTVKFVGGPAPVRLASVPATDDGTVTLPPGTRLPVTATPGTYTVTMAEARGPRASSPAFTLVAPSVVLPLTMQAGQPARFVDAARSIDLQGLSDADGVQRTVTVDGRAVDTDFTPGPGVVHSRRLAFAVPAQTPVGTYRVTFTQTGPTPYTVSGDVRIVAPSVLPDGSSTSSRGRLGVVVVNPGYQDVVDVTIVGAAGDVHTVDLHGADDTLRSVITLPDVSAGTARISSTSRLNGATTPDATFVVDPTTITAPVGLAPDHRVVSPDGVDEVVMQTDGNLVHYANGLALWNSHTGGNPGARLSLQSDGNAVVYRADGRPLWSSGTAGTGAGTRFGLDAAANLVLTTAGGRITWSDFAHTSASLDVLTAGHYLFKGEALFQVVPRAADQLFATMQGDGNWVVSLIGNRVLWATRTGGHPNAYLALQGDGNLIVHAADGTVLWANYAKAAGARVVAQSDGNVVEYASNGKAVWSTRTSVR